MVEAVSTNEGSESLVRGRDDDDEEDDNPSETEARLSEREWLEWERSSTGAAGPRRVVVSWDGLLDMLGAAAAPSCCTPSMIAASPLLPSP